MAREDDGVVPTTYRRSAKRSRSRPTGVAEGDTRATGEARFMRALTQRLDVEPDQHAFLVGQVADDLADRLGQLAHEGRHGEDLVAGGEPRINEQVDDFDVVAPCQVRVAKAPQVLERRDRLRRLAGDVQLELPLGLAGRRGGCLLAARRCRCWSSCRLCGSSTVEPFAAPAARSMRAVPVSTWLPDRYTSISSMPSSPNTNSRTWFECAMPRDLSTWRVRVRSPLSSRLASSSQVSISDDTPSCESASGIELSFVRLVNIAVVPSCLRKSMSRISVGLRAVSCRSIVRLLIGSTTTTDGRSSRTRS